MGLSYFLAYLDPGAGSLFVQALIAAAVTIPFLLRSKIASTIRRFRNHE